MALQTCNSKKPRHKCNQLWNSRINSRRFHYISIYNVMNVDEVVNYQLEFLSSLDLSGVSQHKLSCKVGVPIILLCNINPPRLCNVTRLLVKKQIQNVIEETIINKNSLNC